MTVKRLVTPGRWEGLSGDPRPTNSTHPGKVRAGDTYYATNTGILYISLDDDGSSWVEKLAPSPGVAATSLGKAEDAAHTSGDTGVMSLAVRTDTAAGLGADGDYVPLIVDVNGRLHIAPLVAGTDVIGKVRLVSPDGTEVTLDSQNAISTVEKASIVHLEKPFGKGDLTSDGVQYSAEVTTNDAAWTTVESITIEPPATGAGNIVEVEFGLTYSIKSSSTVKYVKHKAQARDKDGTWVDLYSEVTRAADASAYLEVTYSGRFKPVTDFDAVPFDVQIMIQRQDAGEEASGKVKNSSYVKVIYNAD